jgi:phosphoribosyl-AMP cyclohydrolase
MVKAALAGRANFEAVQSYLRLFLKVHGETVAGEEELVQVLEQELLYSARQGSLGMVLKQEAAGPVLTLAWSHAASVVYTAGEEGKVAEWSDAKQLCWRRARSTTTRLAQIRFSSTVQIGFVQICVQVLQLCGMLELQTA